MQEKTKKFAKRKVRVRWCGVGEAARIAGVSETHVRAVLKGERPGSIRVWGAIEAVKIRDAQTGRLMKRKRK